MRSVLPVALLASLLALPAAGARAATNAGCGVLVATSGSDTPTCGLAGGSECRTINFGIARAAALGASCVFVRAGTYNEILVPVPGIDVTGGFDATWTQGTYEKSGFETRVVGGYDGATAQYLTVRASTAGATTTLTDLILQGPNASGTVNGNGRSSCVVRASGASLVLQHCLLQAGAGAPGAAGSAGLDATSLVRPATAGTGGNGDEFTTTCNATTRGIGGVAGTNTCTSSPSSRAMNGGTGGAGGPMDTDCGVFSLNLTAQPGQPGAHAA